MTINKESLNTNTQTLRTEENLDAEPKQLQALFEGIDEVIYVSDPLTHELLYVNKAFEKNWGEDVLGKKCYRVLQNRDAPCPFCTNDRIMGENFGRAHVWESQNKVIDRWFRCAEKAIHWPDGRVARFVMAIDITERKQTELEYRSIIQTALDGFWISDKEGRLLDVNDAYCRMSGYSREELLQMNMSDFEVAETSEQTDRRIQKYFEQNSDYFETRHRRKNEQIIDVEISAQFVGFGGGVYIVFIRDVTEHKRAEEEHKKARQEQELSYLERLSHSNGTAVAAQMFGLLPLNKSSPDIFDEIVRKYQGLLDKALDQRMHRVEHEISGQLRSLAEELGLLKVGPRDVVNIYNTALKKRTEGENHKKTQAYIEEGRLMVLELMGHLVSYYRNYSLGSAVCRSSKVQKDVMETKALQGA